MSPQPENFITFAWAEGSLPSVTFSDLTGRTCQLADEVLAGKPGISFGLHDNVRMPLTIKQFEPILEQLRDFVCTGDAPSETLFTDYLNRACVLRPVKNDQNAIEIGIIKIPIDMQARVLIRQFEPILEQLHDFVSTGMLTAETKFTDYLNRQCVVRPSHDDQNAIEIVIIEVPSDDAFEHNLFDNSQSLMEFTREQVDQILGLMNSCESLMKFTREHVNQILGLMNSFVGYGSIQPGNK